MLTERRRGRLRQAIQHGGMAGEALEAEGGRRLRRLAVVHLGETRGAGR